MQIKLDIKDPFGEQMLKKLLTIVIYIQKWQQTKRKDKR